MDAVLVKAKTIVQFFKKTKKIDFYYIEFTKIYSDSVDKVFEKSRVTHALIDLLDHPKIQFGDLRETVPNFV